MVEDLLITHMPLLDAALLHRDGALSVDKSGSTCVVLPMLYQKKPVAVKTIYCDELDAVGVTQFCREALIFSELSHPNIVKFYGICLIPPTMQLIFEWCNHRSLYLVLQSGASLASRIRVRILKDAATGLGYLHNNGIIHRDIKSSNILIHQDGTNGKFTAKICDFGTGRFFRDNDELQQFPPAPSSNLTGIKENMLPPTPPPTKYNTKSSISRSIGSMSIYDIGDDLGIDVTSAPPGFHMASSPKVADHMTTAVGTPPYLPPEVIKNIHFCRLGSYCFKDGAKSMYGPSLDIYSFGCVIWETMTRQVVWGDHDWDEIKQSVVNGDRPSISLAALSITSEHQDERKFEEHMNALIDLMKLCWKANPQDRPTAHQVVNLLNGIIARMETGFRPSESRSSPQPYKLSFPEYAYSPA